MNELSLRIICNTIIIRDNTADGSAIIRSLVVHVGIVIVLCSKRQASMPTCLV